METLISWRKNYLIQESVHKDWRQLAPELAECTDEIQQDHGPTMSQYVSLVFMALCFQIFIIFYPFLSSHESIIPCWGWTVSPWVLTPLHTSETRRTCHLLDGGTDLIWSLWPPKKGNCHQIHPDTVPLKEKPRNKTLSIFALDFCYTVLRLRGQLNLKFSGMGLVWLVAPQRLRPTNRMLIFFHIFLLNLTEGNILVECKKRDGETHAISQLLIVATSLSLLCYFTASAMQEHWEARFPLTATYGNNVLVFAQRHNMWFCKIFIDMPVYKTYQNVFLSLRSLATHPGELGHRPGLQREERQRGWGWREWLDHLGLCIGRCGFRPHVPLGVLQEQQETLQELLDLNFQTGVFECYWWLGIGVYLFVIKYVL